MDLGMRTVCHCYRNAFMLYGVRERELKKKRLFSPKFEEGSLSQVSVESSSSAVNNTASSAITQSYETFDDQYQL